MTSFGGQIVRGMGGGFIPALEDPSAHLPHENQITIEGISLVVREFVRDSWGHCIELEVLGSPESRINGYSTGDQRGGNAYDTRRECLNCLADKVRQAYADKMLKM